MQKKSEIKSIKARTVLDSRKKPTIKVELETDLGRFYALVPSGTSKGKHEAVEKPSSEAVANVNKIIFPALKGKNLGNQKQIDDILIKLDATKRKSRLGANAVLGVSMAACRAGAKSEKKPLWKWISEIAGLKPKIPYPSLLQIEGGLHGRKRGTDIQEFMAVFQEKSFKNNFNYGLKLYRSLKLILLEKYGKVAVRLGMEGAFIPFIRKTEEVLDLIMLSAKKAGLEKKLKIFLDIAAAHEKSGFTGNFYLDLVRQYPIFGFEDPFPEDDFSKWKKFFSLCKKPFDFLIVGDDLTVTNPERMKKAKKMNLCNAVIVKPNQIGTVSETIFAVKLAKSYGWKTIISHRSGETMDDFIADLAVGVGADFIKSGAPSKPERMSKYKRLLKIEKEIHG